MLPAPAPPMSGPVPSRVEETARREPARKRRGATCEVLRIDRKPPRCVSAVTVHGLPGARRIDLPAGFHRGRQHVDDVVLQARVRGPEGVAVVALPRLLLADLQPAPSLCVRRAALRLHRLDVGNVAAGVRRRLAGDAVVVGVARSAALEPLVDDAGAVAVVLVRGQPQPSVRTVFRFRARQVAVLVRIPVLEIILGLPGHQHGHRQGAESERYDASHRGSS